MASAKEDMEKWDSILDEYEQSVGFPKYRAAGLPEEELQSYINMDRSAIEKLTAVDCSEISLRLTQFAFHVQRTINRESARYNWADDLIKDVIADELNNYKGYGYLEKSGQAIKHNEKASSLNNIRRYAKQRIDRLSYLANCIKNLSENLQSVQINKVKNGT
jgi:hypothetical protein